MKHLLIGMVALILGFIGIIIWWKTFGLVMRGVVPISLALFGVIAILSGYRRAIAGKDKGEHLPGKSKPDRASTGALDQS